MQPGRGDQDDLVDGAEQVIDMIRELSTRKGPDQPLPILSLVRADLDEHPGFLADIRRRWLNGPAPCVPHAQVDLDATPGRVDTPVVELPEATQDDVKQVRDILLRLARQLEERPGGRFRLDRFRDVVWLMSQRLPKGEPTHERHDELRKRLRRRARGRLDEAARAVAAQPQFPGWVGWLGRLLGTLLTPLWYRARYSGRAWLITGRYRWFLQQPNLAPGEGSFIELAVRLTADEWPDQVPDQVLRLIVNSLLEDLRASFRGTGLFRRYRTAYPVVLLNQVTGDNGGYHLLRAVNDIRNDTGLLDPLLLVAASSAIPPHGDDPDDRSARPEVCNAIDAVAGLRVWEKNVDAHQQRRSDIAWYLFVLLTPPDHEEAQRRIRLRLAALPPFTAPRVPVGRNRAVLMTLVVIVLGATLGGYIRLGLEESEYSCGPGFTWLGFQSRNPNIVRIHGECVGVTDGSNAALLPSDPLFEQVRTKIHDQNLDAERLHRHQPARPLITLVFVGALTPPPSPAQAEPLAAEREQLAGMAVAQRQQLDKVQNSDPLVRVLIANAGLRTAHGDTVAGIIGGIAGTDRSIVAAIGFNESRRATIEMINSLATAGLPVVSATLSADELAMNQMYFQVSPQNRREAEVAAAYALRHRDSGEPHNGHRITSRARIYFSDDSADIYSNNLAADLADSLRRRKFAVEFVQFTPEGKSPEKQSDRHFSDSREAGRDTCGFDGIVFYAGRPLPDFQGFLGGVSDGCKNSPPFLIADDDVTAYVANEEIRTTNTVPFSYISFAVSPELTDNVEPRARDFYNLLNHMFPAMAVKGRSLDGHAALTYDAAYTAVTAAGYLATGSAMIPVSGGTLWWALASITDYQGAHKKYDGATGSIDFGGVVSRRVPLNKPISVLRVEDGNPNNHESAFCGSRDDPATQPWCPFDD